MEHAIVLEAIAAGNQGWHGITAPEACPALWSLGQERARIEAIHRYTSRAVSSRRGCTTTGQDHSLKPKKWSDTSIGGQEWTYKLNTWWRDVSSAKSPRRQNTLNQPRWRPFQKDHGEADFCGPFPNGQYALVVTDQYSRYPEVEFVTTTSFEATRRKLKDIFSTHGVPETLQTDNSPPFNSHVFAEFAKESGFQRRITLVHGHPKVQGQVEGFNKMINKTISIARRDHIDPILVANVEIHTTRISESLCI